jgi:hypothetical protein
MRLPHDQYERSLGSRARPDPLRILLVRAVAYGVVDMDPSWPQMLHKIVLTVPSILPSRMHLRGS